MDVPLDWEPVAVFAVVGRCIRLEESLTLFDGGAITERMATFDASDSFEVVSDRLDHALVTKSTPGFTDEANRRSHEWEVGDLLVTLDEEMSGALSVSVSKSDSVTMQHILQSVASSPLATIDEGLRSCGILSGVGSVRMADAPTRWHLQGTMDDDDRETLLARLVELGFDDSGLENHFEKDDQTFVLGDYHWIATIRAPASSDR
jgi:hypothetical protein